MGMTTAEQPVIRVVEADGDTKVAEQKRVATHTHIKGLGLEPDGTPIHTAAGFVGQMQAREAAGLIVEMVKERRMAGRAVLFAGPPGTGKTAIALAMSQELGPRVPFHPMVGTEVYSAEVKKTEVLEEAVRRAIGVKVREIKEVYEGEVVEMTAHEARGASTLPYEGGKVISHVSLTLRTARGTKSLKLDPSVYESLVRAQVRVGDVVYIESNSGIVKRLGRLDAFKNEYDLETDQYVPLPKTEVHRKREVIQEVTLHDLDLANAQPSGTSSKDDILSLMTSMMPRKRVEITDKLRQEVNLAVDRFIQQGIAELVPGVLFIDEVHSMDWECFAFLHKLMESPIAPIIVLATNRPHGPINGSPGLSGNYCLPDDLVDRLLVVPTHHYSHEEMRAIIALRVKTEGVKVSEASLDHFAQLASQHTLRYPLHLLTPASILASANKHPQVEVSDIDEACSLFLDPLAEIDDPQDAVVQMEP